MPPTQNDRQGSSNDLLFELLREMIEERSRDQRDGITIRALNRQLSEHSEVDDRRLREFDGRLRDLEKSAAKAEGAIDTGRWQLPPAQLPPTQINIDSRSKRSDRPSIVVAALKQPQVIAGIIAGATLVAHLLLRLLH